MSRQSVLALAVISLLASHVPTAVAAPSPPAEPGADRRAVRTEPSTRGDVTFATMLDRIRVAAESGDWANKGWRDRDLEEGLNGLLEQAMRATGRKGLELPVEFDLVRPAAVDAPVGGGGRLHNKLWVSREPTASAGHAVRSIILADGNVRVSFATECVIIARGAVEVAHGQRNVILAGHYVHVSHDGNHGARPRIRPPQLAPERPEPEQDADEEPPPGSIVLSGGSLDISHATDTICSAPQLVEIAHANGVTVVNSPNLRVSHKNDLKEVQAEDLTLAPPEAANPLANRLKVTQVVHNDTVARRFAALDLGGAEIVVRPGAEIRDGAGKPVPGLEGWKLTFVCEQFALFSNGREDAGFLAPRER